MQQLIKQALAAGLTVSITAQSANSSTGKNGRTKKSRSNSTRPGKLDWFDCHGTTDAGKIVKSMKGAIRVIRNGEDAIAILKKSSGRIIGGFDENGLDELEVAIAVARQKRHEALNGLKVGSANG